MRHFYTTSGAMIHSERGSYVARKASSMVEHAVKLLLQEGFHPREVANFLEDDIFLHTSSVCTRPQKNPVETGKHLYNPDTGASVEPECNSKEASAAILHIDQAVNGMVTAGYSPREVQQFLSIVLTGQALSHCPLAERE